MQQTGAWLARYALEQLDIRYPFGIPGGHNTQLYDELNNSTTAGCPAAATGRRRVRCEGMQAWQQGSVRYAQARVDWFSPSDQRSGSVAVSPLHWMGCPVLPTACVKLDALRLMTMPSAHR